MSENVFLPTIDHLFNGFSQLIIVPVRLTTNKNLNIPVQRKADGMRNFNFSGIQNINKIKLLGNGTILWEFENKNKVDSVSCHIFTKLNIIPTRYLIFTSFRIELDGSDPITVAFEYIYACNNQLLMENYIKMFKYWYYDIGYNLLAFGEGALGHIYSPNYYKQDDWKNTLEEFSLEQLQRMNEDGTIIDWYDWSKMRTKIRNRLLSEKLQISSDKTIYTDKIKHMTVSFCNVE